MLDVLEQALQRLPHGPEFRFLDRLVSLVPGQEGVAEYRVRGDEPFLRGHFPGQPLFPGVLLIEAGAQLLGVVAQSGPARPLLPELKLTALRAVKITGSARPGQTILLKASEVKPWGNLVCGWCEAYAEGRLLFAGEITLGGAG
jgi:3-hydroxyacyl-[acyl-carrier-protein] dehydratase